MKIVQFINLAASNVLPSGGKEFNCVCELEERLRFINLEGGAVKRSMELKCFTSAI
jgi:hypothetical protein